MTDNSHVKAYLRQFGTGYLGEQIFSDYPEAKILPAYLREHFTDARVVLDLGFGSGLWFWASFLPALERLDGIDAYAEALEEAQRVFQAREVPVGYALAHAELGEPFTLQDLQALRPKRGTLVIQDYREPWPAEITRTRYDLVTEHGGGLGEMRTEHEFKAVFRRAGEVLKPSGAMLFVNFKMKERSALAKQVGRSPQPTPGLGQELYGEAVEQAGMEMMDFHAVDNPEGMPRVQTFFYGYARKRPVR